MSKGGPGDSISRLRVAYLKDKQYNLCNEDDSKCYETVPGVDVALHSERVQ